MHRLYTIVLSCFLALLLFPLLAANRPEGVRFVQNKGQWPSEVLFRAELPDGFLFLKKQSLHYVFYDGATVAALHAGKPVSADKARLSSTEPIPPTQIRAHGVEVQLQNSQNAQIETHKPIAEHLNYFFGNDPARWAAKVPVFGEIIYRNIYPDIDLRIFAYYQTVKYEFIVRPGADASQIALRYTGADSVRLDNGQLLVTTSLQPFREEKPYSFTDRGDVPAEWTLTGNRAGFRFPAGYDRTQTLTIDPTLVFSTYSGSVADNWGHTATYDRSGNLYSGGTVFGAQFTASVGAYQVRFGGQVDIAVLKFSPDGDQLIYATYLGGEFTEVPHSILVDPAGSLLIMGTTSSARFPVGQRAFQRQFAGGTVTSPISSLDFDQGSDLFVTKLDSLGERLLAGTYIGGSRNDGLGNINPLIIKNYGDNFRGEIVTDAAGNVFVASVTTSADFPLQNAARTQLAGQYDGVLFSLSPDLATLRWSTLLGGDGYDAIYGLKMSPSGVLYACGVTRSTDLPTHATALHPRLLNAATTEDGFVARFVNQQLTQLTYLGTESADIAYLLDFDTAENVHIFGLTRGQYPVSDGVYRSLTGGQFVHALDPTLSRTFFSTRIGSGRSTPDISPTAFLVNECGNIYLAGWGGAVNARTGINFASSTIGLPVTSDAIKRTTNGSNYWLAVLEKGAQSLLYATFFGSENPTNPNEEDRGDHVDGGTCRFDKSGVIYHAACACGGSRFPASPTAWSRQNRSSNCNNAAFKIDVDRLKASFDAFQGNQQNVVQGCAPLSLTFVNTSEGGITYQWDIGGQATSSNPEQTAYTFTRPGEYTVVLRAFNRLSCKQVDVATRVIRVFPAAFRVSADTAICPGKSVQLLAEGARTYVWTPAQGLSNPNVANPVATPTQTTQYTVNMTNEFGCTVRRQVTVSVDDSFRPNVTLRTSSGCGQVTQVELLNQSTGADEIRWSMGNGDTLKIPEPGSYRYEKSGQYTITVTARRGGCTLTVSLPPVDVENLKDIPNVITANNDGKNDLFDTGLSGAKVEIYNRWGRLIYNAAPYANNWGRDVPHGLYYFMLTTATGVRCKGWVEVLQ